MDLTRNQFSNIHICYIISPLRNKGRYGKQANLRKEEWMLFDERLNIKWEHMQRLGRVKSQLHWIQLSRGINFVIQLHFPCTHSGLRKGTSLFFWEAGYALNFFRICGCFDAIKRHVHTHLFSPTNGHRVRVNPFSLSNFDANCWVRASGNFKSKRSKPKGIGLFFVKAYHHPTQKSRNQAAARCLRVQHVKNQVAARVTAHFLPLIIVIVLL